MDDNTLVQKLLSKPSFTFDDCTKYALEYEQTEDQLGTHKKNTGITVNAVTAQDSELSPGKQINQTALVCERCDKLGTEPVNVLCQLKNYQHTKYHNGTLTN